MSDVLGQIRDALVPTGFWQRAAFQGHWIFLPPIVLCVLVVGVAYGGLAHGYLIAHALAEFATVCAAWMLCSMGWKTQALRPNSLLIVLAGGFFWVGILDFVHVLSYEGMGLLSAGGGNTSALLWLAARAVQAMAMVLAPLLAHRSVRFWQPFLGFGIVAVVLLLLVFGGAFPAAYIEGSGLTAFKRASEAVVIVVALVAIMQIAQVAPDTLHPDDKPLLAWSLVLMILSEGAFMAFSNVFDSVNLFGHLLKIWSFWLLFEAAMQIHLMRPTLSHQLLAAVVEQSPSGVMVTTRDGVVDYVNPQFERDSGYRAAEITGRHVNMLGADDMPRPILDTMWQTIARGKLWSGYFHNRRKDGSLYWDKSIISSIRDAEGRIIRYVATKEDVTQKRQVEEYLLDSDNAVTRMLVGALEAMVHLLEMRDAYTAGHGRNVAVIAMLIADHLGLPKVQTEALRLAAMIHDIGKINVPLDVLNKPGPLTADEFRIIQAHPQTAYDALKDIPFPWDVPRIVLCHHERWDGSGYPHGIAGEAIPIEAQILSVADVLDAVSNDRPYRPGRGPDEAFAVIRDGAGRSFSPVVAQAAAEARLRIEAVLRG